MGVDCFMATKQIVVFKLQGKEFGIDIMEVLEILNYEEIRSVPEVPEYIEGIINVRGTVYSIINLRTRLGSTPYTEEKDSKFILLNLEAMHVGFLVDSVTEILTVEEEDIEQGPRINNKNKVSCIQGVVKQEEHIILILDVQRIVSEEDNIILEEECGILEEGATSENAAVDTAVEDSTLQKENIELEEVNS